MHRAVILTTLTVLLLTVTGITLARESTIGPESGSLTESTLQDATTTTGELTDTTVREPTDTTDEGSNESGEPSAGSVVEDSTEAEVKKVGKPEGVGKARGVGGKPDSSGTAKGDEGETNGGGGKEKVTLCHKGKTLTVGAPALDAHLRHGDTAGPCPTGGTLPEPSSEAPGPGAAKNGGGNGQQKVTVCHKGKTLMVGEPAQAAHLRHGDTEGPCAGP